MKHEDAYEKALELLMKAEVSEEEGMEILAGVIDEWREVEEGMKMLAEVYASNIPKA